MKENKNHISVNICTYRRIQMLERLLRKLALQETAGYFDFSVVVVDNDAIGSAQEKVFSLKRELGLDITYAIEPIQTIPVARNRALKLSKGDYIGIIDDDELPPQHWLITMYKAIQTFDVDGVLGPVHPYFENQPPAWLIKSGLCERPVYRTGTLLQWNQTRTGNVLLKKKVFDQHHLCFDIECKTSGSDREFFREAMRLGYRFIGVEEAPVYEVVPLERQTKSYFLKRTLAQASNRRKYIENHMHGFSKIFAPIKAIAALMFYTMVLPFCFIAGSHIMIKDAIQITYYLSWLLTMFGIDMAKKRDF